ncbi:MAG: hypothetical protein M0Z67_04240 [Nitrospiraceae bacterium]|nr:hypothetical protein [Nitrospiraceae bacterium]
MNSTTTKRQGLNGRQSIRLLRAIRAYKTINPRIDARLLDAGPLSPTLLFLRRWVQPCVLDLSAFISLDGTAKEERIKRDLDEQAAEVFCGIAEGYLQWQYHKTAVEEGLAFCSVFATEHPSTWVWVEADRTLCHTIYGNLRSLDILADDVLRGANTELTLMREQFGEAVQDIRLRTPDELAAVVNRIKSLTPGYWYEGEHRPGRYPQMSAEEEARRLIYRQQREAERGRARLAEVWSDYSSQVRQGKRDRNVRIERACSDRAQEVAPDYAGRIKAEIERMDRVNADGEEVNQ